MHKRASDPLDQLKSALLSYALHQVHGDNVDDSNMHYASFDGSKLPVLSGYDILNACMSYYNKTTRNEKHNAIVRYLQKNLSTREQVEQFFQTFVSRDHSMVHAEDYIDEHYSDNK